MQKTTPLILSLLVIMLLTSCAPGANPSMVKSPDIAGFWQGLWHGFITLFTFIISLFNDKVNIYEVNNNGGWYNFGYLLGLMFFWGGSSGGACKSKKWCN